MDRIVCKEKFQVGNRLIHKGQVLYLGIDYGYGHVGYFTKSKGNGGKKMLTLKEYETYKENFTV